MYNIQNVERSRIRTCPTGFGQFFSLFYDTFRYFYWSVAVEFMSIPSFTKKILYNLFVKSQI